jgi:AraC-like DNA-binding protein
MCHTSSASQTASAPEPGRATGGAPHAGVDWAHQTWGVAGFPPVAATPHYLTRWRIEIAARRLRDTDLPVATIATEVGYTSEYAFNRAFTRLRGHPPGGYRRRIRGTASSPG